MLLGIKNTGHCNLVSIRDLLLLNPFTPSTQVLQRRKATVWEESFLLLAASISC